jgi:hypothetical protein
MRLLIVSFLLTFLSIPCSIGQLITIDKRDPQDVTNELNEQRKLQERNPEQELSQVPRSWIIIAVNPAFSKVGLGPNRHTSYAGHMFVIIATEDVNKQETRIDSYGFYPVDDSASGLSRAILSEVPGTVKDNLTGPEAGNLNENTRIFSVEVSQRQALNAVSSIWSKFPLVFQDDRDATAKYEKKALDRLLEDHPAATTDDAERSYGPTYTSYSLHGNDCVNLADTAARGAGLRTPSPSGMNLIPGNYLKSLEELNTSGTPGTDDVHVYTRLNFAYSPNGDPVGWYEGTTDNSGKYHGQGTINAPSGIRYEMTFDHGVPKGAGTISFPDGSHVTGVFNGSTLSGGIFTDVNGGAHPVSANPDGSLHLDAAGSGGNRSSGQSGGSRADHAAGQEHLPSDHWSLDGHDMGENHMGTLH